MYGTEQADIFELMHKSRGKDYRAEAEEVARRARLRKPDADSLLDVACGTGAHLRHFAELFGHVEGLELSEPMLAMARKRLPARSAVHSGDMRAFRLGRTFDVVTCMFGSIGYAATTAELDAILRCFAAHLVPGGVVAVDPWWFAETFQDGYVAGHVARTDGRTVARVSHSTREGDTCAMRVHYLVADARTGVRHVLEEHTISLFTREQYETAFAAAGLSVEYVAGLNAGRGLFVGTLLDGAQDQHRP
ncbi:class I SAM-dependent methyltransferase [Streptomyces sp. Li-HN-5-11]|uniref:class I SAM-dependent DNA methyltransferase n=1 Tax=Streptomyces sp. Li-HN-5-11 TaxID=3075432 RepID=UPI0028A740DD|nr:class I SAM-dependent methyltransferase [Streptomyces sp. Li-HN-5-11]WNM31387.1 class I SAM-dependent methyltransferase [Streptomyces sp. Li-HN-5-11]